MLQTKLAKLAQNTVLRLHIKLTWFKEIFDEYSEEKSKYSHDKTHRIKVFEHLILCVFLILKIFPRLFCTFNISPTHGDWCDFPECVGTSFPYPTW